MRNLVSDQRLINNEEHRSTFPFETTYIKSFPSNEAETKFTYGSFRQGRYLPQTSLETDTVHGKSVLALLGTRILVPSSRATEMIWYKEKLTSWWHCVNCGFQSSKKFLADGSGAWENSSRQRTSESRKSENHDQYFGSPCGHIVFNLGNGIGDCLYIILDLLYLLETCLLLVDNN